MQCCDIFEVFDEKNNLIKEYKYWKLLIRNSNSTLGNCVLITKRHIERFSDITVDEMIEFTGIVKDIENALKSTFSYDKINWQMLMMKDKHVHFHIIPRYASSRICAGVEWIDEGWPRLPPGGKSDVPINILQEVKKEIIKRL